MKLDERVRERLRAMIEKGEAVLQTYQPNPPGVLGFPTLDYGQFMGWKSQTTVCLHQTLGSEHEYTREFQAVIADKASPKRVEAGLNILHAALEDVEQGHLDSFRDLVAAEVFSDFLEQAQHLLDHGYKSPAASLAGAVLENGLRSLAECKGIPTKDTDNLATLNRKIADKGIYPPARQKQVVAWAAVRNAADHGRFDDFTESQVGALIRGVRDFVDTEL